MSKLYKISEAKLKEIIRKYFSLDEKATITFHYVKNNEKIKIATIIELKGDD